MIMTMSPPVGCIDMDFNIPGPDRFPDSESGIAEIGSGIMIMDTG
jgi:hypothetical protein